MCYVRSKTLILGAASKTEIKAEAPESLRSLLGDAQTSTGWTKTLRPDKELRKNS
jgi:hypothetical protein